MNETVEATPIYDAVRKRLSSSSNPDGNADEPGTSDNDNESGLLAEANA